MGKTLYLECASSISGDMVVGALLDLGANEAGLRRALDSLHVDGFEIAVTRKQVAAIDACDFDVVLDEAHESHDHDMDYLYGNLDGGEDDRHHHHDHDGDHHHHHHHDEDHDHEHHHHHHHDDEHGHEHHHHHDDEHEHGEQHAHGRLRERGAAAKAVVASIVDQFHNREVRRAKEEAPEAADEAAPAEGMVAESDVDHGHSHSHDHAHDHGHSHGHHHHEHRSPADIAAIIDAADLAPRAKQTAHRIFDIVAQAEAKAHGLPIEEVHFHEVGAVDSIVYVVSVAYCLDDLDVTDAYVTPLAEGHGPVRSRRLARARAGRHEHRGGPWPCA